VQRNGESGGKGNYVRSCREREEAKREHKNTEESYKTKRIWGGVEIWSGALRGTERARERDLQEGARRKRKTLHPMGVRSRWTIHQRSNEKIAKEKRIKIRRANKYGKRHFWEDGSKSNTHSRSVKAGTDRNQEFENHRLRARPRKGGKKRVARKVIKGFSRVMTQRGVERTAHSRGGRHWEKDALKKKAQEEGLKVHGTIKEITRDAKGQVSKRKGIAENGQAV